MNKLSKKTVEVIRYWLDPSVVWSSYDGGFWIRILGRGISISNKEKHPPLFSERNGYRKVLRIGKWGIEWLKAI